MNPASRARPAASRALIVLGMHRSGTSALAGALRVLGLDLGDNLMPPTAFNSEGHFEHAEVVAYHERLLHALGRRWDDLRPLPPGWWERPDVAALEGELRALLAREFDDSLLWAVKDPRMCRLLPAWHAPLRALRVDARFVLVARDPREVADSLAARDGIPGWKARLLYLDHLLAAEAGTRGRPRAFVTYDELLRDATGAFERIGTELGLDWSERVRAEAGRLQAFLHPRLRHHTAADGTPQSRLERITAECYAGFAAAAAGPSARLAETLEPIASLLHEVVEPWSRGMVEDAERRLAESERDLVATRDSIQALAREIDASRVAHQAREGVEAELRAALEARGAEVARARTHIDSLATEIGAARRAHEVRNDTEAALREAVRARDLEVEKARAHIDNLAAEIDQARRAHDVRDAHEQRLREAVDAGEAEIARLRGHAESLAAVVEEARREHLERQSEEAGLRQALADREAEIASARQHIDELGRDLEAERRTNEAHERMESDLLRASRTHQEEARSARESLAVLVQELDQARHAVKERTEREADVSQALARATAALEEHVSLERELELSLLDSERALGDLKRRLSGGPAWWPRRRPPEDVGSQPAGAPSAAHFALDAAPAAEGQADTTVTGWHVPPPGRTLRRLVARAGTRRFPAESGQPRPDVEQAHPGLAGAPHSGFTVRLQLPPGEHRLLFEAEYEDGSWHPLGAQDVNVRRPPLVAHVDAPRGRAVSGAVRFAGWCCHPLETIARVTLTFRGRTVECAYGLVREDVAAVYPGYPGAARSGFEATCPIAPGRGRVTVQAHLESGGVLAHTVAEPLVVLPAAVHRPLQRLRTVSRTTAVVRDIAVQLWRRGRRGGPWPPVKTMPRRMLALIQRHRAVARLSEPSGAVEDAPRAASDPYTCWLRVNAWHSHAASDLERRLRASTVPPPVISVVMAPRSAGAAVEMRDSLRGQVHDGWQLCLAVPDEADARSLRSTLDDASVRICHVPEGASPAAALNAAAAAADGEFLVFTERPLALAPDALAEMALHAARHPEDDVVYCDHDLLDAAGRRHTPWLKPAWSPELLLSCMYLGPAWMVRRSLFAEVGGYREGLRGAEDHDLVLRAAERARHVGHVPLVLFHDRPERRLDVSLEARRARARAVHEAFARRGVAATVEARPWPGGDALQPRFADEGPTVTVVAVPRRGGSVSVADLEALRASPYGPLTVVAAGDGLASAQRASRAALANAAARAASTEYLLFVDAGTVPRDPGWVSTMMGYARLPGVGAVGARIVRPNGVVEHEGAVRGARDGRGGALLLQGQRDGAPYDGVLAANRSALSGAGLLTPRRLFEEMGGFDTGALGDSHYDLDYGLRLGQNGYRSVYVPGAELVLDRELSATLREHPQAEACFRRRHPPREEPFLSPYLAVERSRLELTPRRLARGNVRRLRALMCSFNLNREGAPHVQFELTLRLKQAGALDPIVFCHQDGPLREEYEAAGVDVVIGRHPLSGVFDAAGYERAIASFADVARGHEAELVYANTVHTFYAVAAAERAGLPSVWNLHESEPVRAHFAHLGPPIAARALECFRYPYRVVFVAEATREVFQPLNSEHNFVVVHGALDMARLRAEAERWPRARARRSLELADGEIALLLLGTVCERKGQEDLPLALAGLPPRVWPRVRCFIVGERGLPYGRRVQRAWEALPAGLRERVAILPETAEPGRFYQAADVFVCTSRVESFPRVTLEAMAHGLPIVTTPVFGIREQVRPGVNALLYEPGDVPALRGALTRLLESDALRRELARQAQPVLECLDDFEAMVRGYGDIFQEARLSKAPAEEGEEHP